MKKDRKTIRFDYSKIDDVEDYRYFGLHSSKGRIHVDTKRLKKFVSKDYLFDGMFKNRSTPYLELKKKHANEYKINLIRDLILQLKNDWFNEYKPLFMAIRSPKNIEESAYIDGLNYCGSVHDGIDEVRTDAFIKGLKRKASYERIINNLYCSFINKICIEIDRFTMIFLKELGSTAECFSYKTFRDFSEGLNSKKKGSDLKKLPKYETYNLLHKVHNFLKHNSLDSYETLKKFYPGNVYSIDNNDPKKRSKIPYENGMFAGNWIILKEDYIDHIFDKLIIFFEAYCYQYLGEDPEESKWNYDDYFYYNIYKVLKDDYLF